MHQCLREERRDVPREREREPAVADAELRSFDHGWAHAAHHPVGDWG